MQTLFSIILPLLAIRLFLNPVPSLYLLSPNPPPLTATAQYSYLNHIPAFSLVFIRRSSSSSPFRPPVVNSRRNIVFILLLSGDVEINPGPNCPFSRHPPRSSNETFTLYSLNIRSLLNTKNSTALIDLASSSRPPDLIALQETKISTSSTDAHISYSKPPGYSLHSFPRITPSSKSPEISGGGSAFLVREPAIVLNSSCHTFKSFECSFITLQLASDTLTVFNIYRPPTSSNYSQKPSVFLYEFASLLSLAAPTPNEFVLVGDFNVHVDTPSDTFPSSFLNLLSSVNLVQHVNFPTHTENHTLDLLIISTASLLSPKVSRSAFNITDHYLIMPDLEIKPFVRPPPPTHSFRLTGSIDRPAFIKSILDSQLILNPPSSLEDLLSCYNSTLSTLLNIHAPFITKQSSHANNPWFTSYIQAFKTFCRHLEHVYNRTIDPTSRAKALTNLKSATHRYHKLTIAAKQKYYSSLIHSSSSNPRHLWRAVNSLLHRKSPSPLPTSIPSPSIADTFCSFFSDKISSLRVTLQSLLASQSSTADPPPTPILPLPPSLLLLKFSILPLKLKSYCS